MVELDEDRFFVNNCSDYSQGESFAVQQRNDGSVEVTELTTVCSFFLKAGVVKR